MVAIFPSDHCLLDEEQFMHTVQTAALEVQRFPQELILLDVTPTRALAVTADTVDGTTVAILGVSKKNVPQPGPDDVRGRRG
jgi:hypothetical protein